MPSNSEERDARLERIGRRILLLSQSSISINMKYLNPAVFELIPYNSEIKLGTDGVYLFYDPEFLIEEYKKEKTTMTRNYMHVILHCIFQHTFIHTAMNQPYWDLACDIAVENLINEQHLPCFHSGRELQQKKVLSQLDLPFKELTAEKLYRYFLDNDFSNGQMNMLRSSFFADDHRIWYDDSENDEPDGQPGDPDNKDHRNSRQDRDQMNENDSEDGHEKAEKDWKDISRRIQVDMETMSKEAGDQHGELLTDLKEMHRERYDYTKFLRKFSVMGEEMMINDEEFDNIFYAYGLELYGDMPLVEPLEYKEVKRVRDFVIAVDTSASTSGDEVQKFMQKTFNILKESDNFFSRVNLYLIQADVGISSITEIHDSSEIDRAVAGLQLKGGGGTDFRPVFGYVNDLLKQGKFKRLKGIIYFTDGYGPFPQKRPLYDTAFVFLRREHEDPQVPPWAIKVVLDEEDL